MKLLIIDNYDSFTYNLYHYFERGLGDSGTVDVYRNDQISSMAASGYDGIILSPGPGLPDEAGNMKSIIQNATPSLPILGICLGHQAIAEVYGAQLKNLSAPLHGVELTTKVTNHHHPLFNGIPESIQTGHYHSWGVSHDDFPDCLIIDAMDEKGEIMAISHKHMPRHGIQFHPESVMTPFGMKMIENWIAYCSILNSKTISVS